jgi:RNA polymerase sigma factor (sigma-70 family)
MIQQRERLPLVKLLRQVQRGGREANIAAEQIYRHYQPEFMRFLRFRKFSFDPARAEEISQDAFLKLFKNISSLLSTCVEQDNQCNDYFYQILHNCAIDVLRKQQKSPHIVDMTTEPSDDDDAVDPLQNISDENAGQFEHEICVEQAFAEFAEQHPRCAQAISMRAEGYDSETIAEAVESKSSAIRTFVYDCRKHLEKLIREHCMDALPSRGNTL